MTSFLKKTLLSYAVILSFGTYALWNSAPEGQAASIALSDTATPPAPQAASAAVSEPAAAAPTARPTTQANPAKTPAAPAPLPTPPPAAAPSGRYRDGSYTGSVADAYYGYIQVQAIIKGGKLADVIFLQYPDDRGTSIEINRQAMPFLRQEAIAAQGIEIDGVTGATDSAVAFQESLSSALAQAATARNL